MTVSWPAGEFVPKWLGGRVWPPFLAPRDQIAASDGTYRQLVNSDWMEDARVCALCLDGARFGSLKMPWPSSVVTILRGGRPRLIPRGRQKAPPRSQAGVGNISKTISYRVPDLCSFPPVRRKASDNERRRNIITRSRRCSWCQIAVKARTIPGGLDPGFWRS